MADLEIEGASIFPQPGDVVQHYKGGLYIVLMLATDEDTGKERVVYTPCLPPKKGQRVKVWGRLASDWAKRVNATTPRFLTIRRASRTRERDDG